MDDREKYFYAQIRELFMEWELHRIRTTHSEKKAKMRS